MSTPMQLSIRSLLVVTTSVAFVCAMYAAIPLSSHLVALAILLLAGASTMASIGYDFNGQVSGVAIGAILGSVVGWAVYAWLSRPVI